MNKSLRNRLKLVKASDGANLPIFTNNPNDKRLQAYIDSSEAYNYGVNSIIRYNAAIEKGKRNNTPLKNIPTNGVLSPWFGTNIMPLEYKIASPTGNEFGPDNADSSLWTSYSKFIKPVQPIVYKPEENNDWHPLIPHYFDDGKVDALNIKLLKHLDSDSNNLGEIETNPFAGNKNIRTRDFQPQEYKGGKKGEYIDKTTNQVIGTYEDGGYINNKNMKKAKNGKDIVPPYRFAQYPIFAEGGDFAPSLQMDPNTQQNGSIMNIGGQPHEQGGTPLDTNNSGQPTIEAEVNETTDGEFMFSHNTGYNKDNLPTLQPSKVKITFADKTKQIESKYSRKNSDDYIANNTKDIEMNRVKTDNQMTLQKQQLIDAVKNHKKIMKNGGYLPKADSGLNLQGSGKLDSQGMDTYGGYNWGNGLSDNSLLNNTSRDVANISNSFNPNQVGASGQGVSNLNLGKQGPVNNEGSGPGADYFINSANGALSTIPDSIAYGTRPAPARAVGNTKAVQDLNKFNQASTSTGTKVGRAIGIAALNFVPFVGSALAQYGSKAVDTIVDKRREQLTARANVMPLQQQSVNEQGVPVYYKKGGYLPKAKNGLNWTDENTYDFSKAMELGVKGLSVSGPAERQKLYQDNTPITKFQLEPNYNQANLNYNTAASMLNSQAPQVRGANLANLYSTAQGEQNNYDFQIQNQNKQLGTQYEARKQSQNQYNIANKYNVDTINAQNQAVTRNNQRQFLTDFGNYTNSRYDFASQDRTNRIGYSALNNMYKDYTLAPEYNDLIKQGYSRNKAIELIKFKYSK